MNDEEIVIDVDIDKDAAHDDTQCEAADINNESDENSPEISLEKKLDDALAELESERESKKRVWADFENYRRRTRTDGMERYDAGRSSVIEDIIPILDSLEMAVNSAKDEDTKQGVSMVVRQMQSLLEKWGVTAIDRVGEQFDPHLENAVMTGEAGEGEPNTVLLVLRKGYKLGGKVLREAMVKVAP